MARFTLALTAPSFSEPTNIAGMEKTGLIRRPISRQRISPTGICDTNRIIVSLKNYSSVKHIIHSRRCIEYVSTFKNNGTGKWGTYIFVKQGHIDIAVRSEVNHPPSWSYRTLQMRSVTRIIFTPICLIPTSDFLLTFLLILNSPESLSIRCKTTTESNYVYYNFTSNK